MKATTASSLLILLMHLAAHPAMAATSIKDLVSHETLAAYCATVPLDSETTTTLPGLNGTDVTGEVHCEAEDLAAGGDKSVFDITGSTNGGDDDSDDDSGDDNSGDDDSGDDDSSDDSDDEGDDD
ncbi:hypothetical protein [Devosia sp.]|uniref:hypothetical protein n=1 Tax=Devosia sp. TaxID=1871048 RepID=UPI001AC854B4|nr:hypothetical protein [Devosia sp.]MBN9310148.1 hypothetical protein [Devosia sp.]